LFIEYNHLTSECYCLSSYDNQNNLIINKCKDHLDKRHQTQNNNQITVVFFLTVGGRKNLRQIKRLIRAIYSRQHYYLIHVDNVCI
jgi:RNase P protein component